MREFLNWVDGQPSNDPMFFTNTKIVHMNPTYGSYEAAGRLDEQYSPYSGMGASVTPGDSEVEEMVCPSGYTLEAGRENNVDKFWCQGPGGFKVDPVYKPGATQESSMGVLGWSIAVAGALLLGTVMFGGK